MRTISRARGGSSVRNAKPLRAVLVMLVLAIAVAGCTEVLTVNATGGQPGTVEILDYELTTVEGLTGLRPGIEGTLKNNYDERLYSVTLLADFYDCDGMKIGTGMELVKNIQPGEIVPFTIDCYGEDYGEGFPDSAKLRVAWVTVN
ncbi:hypothetical protein ES705_27258 [subsurface metagenome]